AVKGEKTLLFFPTAACRSAAGGWDIPIHGWIYRRTELSHLRRAGLRLAQRYVQLRHRAPAEALSLFGQRFGSFLADNERNERITLHLGGTEFTLRRSRSDGHIRDAVSLRFPQPHEGWITF